MIDPKLIADRNVVIRKLSSRLWHLESLFHKEAVLGKKPFMLDFLLTKRVRRELEGIYTVYMASLVLALKI